MPPAGPSWAQLILWLPLLSMALCGLCAALRVKNRAPAWITVGFLGASFILTVALYFPTSGGAEPVRVHIFEWFNIHWTAGSFIANFSLYIDSLTLLWMLFVTGLGTLIALYAAEYMEADVGRGYARFFAGVSVFLFAMTALVMGDNLVMLYLGWEGVGFASYWLIGYYYKKPSAVAAAKKAFIMNRIGDLGLALAIWFIWLNFNTVEYHQLFDILRGIAGQDYLLGSGGWTIDAIPFLLMLGAFGKSAQVPLYVWLPDAMEGPTPVSALIHAATMVTAGVYLLARMVPVMEFHPYALPTVAWIGAGTALLAATIGMAQYDIKRIMAYSTVSQLGYMFAGIGVLATYGAAFHVFTHAFFKAVLFLTCGAIMHGFAGQLDLRRISGLRHMPGWKITSYTMLIGCLCLAGFPLTSGYFSKDIILAEAFANHYAGVGWVLLITAGLTAYYTFRVWFRVCAGPVHYEMGDEHHEAEEARDEHAHALPHAIAEPTKKATEHARHHDEHHHKPHAPRLAINFVLIVITIGAILAAIAYFTGWVKRLVDESSAAIAAVHAEHGTIFNLNPHVAMYFISGAIAAIGIAVAWHFHLGNRKAADSLRARLLSSPITRWLPTAMENKWYVDEIYDALFRTPLWIIGHALSLFDRYIVDGLFVNGTARLPRMLGRQVQPMQNGVLQSYGVAMIGGAALLTLLVIHMPELLDMIARWRGGGG